ncbi:MAG: glucose-1-phosphate cytidylyltransferase [Rhodospirillales bacterium]|nr:glucose-1-phosphate cytidylyltransferase [Rhodospirillales bacterium]
MKTVILCGGMGTRLAEETELRPKPMVEIGEFPILWHIMKIYDHYGFKDFTLPLGYKGEVIKDYFVNYYHRTSDITIELAGGQIGCSNGDQEDWTVRMIDTGPSTMTGGRLHRLKSILRPEGTFMLTYGDGVTDVNIRALLEFHKKHGKLATITAVRPPARFGTMQFDGEMVTRFHEKPQTGEGWINGGFFVFEPEIFDYLHGDETVLEGAPLESLAKNKQLMAFRHAGFWQCMDTVRDRNFLSHQWIEGSAPWKIWEDK